MQILICPKCKTKVSKSDTVCPKCKLKLILKCPKCSSLTRLGSASCKSCGFVFVKFCPECKSANFPTSSSCRKCGRVFASAAKKAINQKNEENILRKNTINLEDKHSLKVKAASFANEDMEESHEHIKPEFKELLFYIDFSFNKC